MTAHDEAMPDDLSDEEAFDPTPRVVRDDYNPFREARRRAKAEAMVRWLRHYQVTAEQAEQMDEQGWAALAALANVSKPSETTKAMVIGALSMAPTTGAR